MFQRILSSTHPRQVLLYVNQVYADDCTGQGTFERELVGALREHAAELSTRVLHVFTVRRPDATQPEPAAAERVSLVLDKSHRWSYVAHQVRLLVALGSALIHYWRDDVTIYARYAPSSIAPVLLSTLFGRRLVIRTGPVLQHSASLLKHRGRWTSYAVSLGFGWNCRKADPIVVVAEQTRQSISATLPFVRGKTVVIPNGANVEHFPLCARDRSRWGLAPEGLVLGFIGYLYEDQGVDTVLHALACLSHDPGGAPQLLVVGNGPRLLAWRQLSHELGIASCVVFTGERPFSEIPSAIAACDVMLAPFTRRSLAVTGSSAIKLFEYLACDKPVLASLAADHQFLSDAHVGWLVEPDDVQAWADAIRVRMSQQRVGLEGRGRQLIEGQYSFRRVAQRIWSACFEHPRRGACPPVREAQ